VLRQSKETPLTQLTDQSEFDLYGPAVVADPYPTYHALRNLGPVVTVGGIPQVTTYELADQVLKDAAFGRGNYGDLIRSALGPGPLYESFSRWMLYLDPPDHTRLRTLVMRAFTPRAVERLRGQIQAIVDRLIDQLLEGESADFLRGFAYPLPVHVICELLNVPAQDREEFKSWSADLGRGLQISATSPEIIARGNAAADGLNRYFRELIDQRRRRPEEGFLDDLIAAEHEGGRLSEDELMATVVLLFFAGHETTVNLLGNGTLALLREPGEWDALRRDPSLARAAVEEMLRIDTPVQRASRIALVDSELAGQTIRAGEMISILIGGANRDPAKFPDPDRFSLRRAGAGTHLSFATGPHYCVGATLARVEGEIAMATLARRIPGLALASDDVVFRPNVILRGLQALPVTLGGPAGAG
jgi:pimeloyl-[acyl-carrier protein] synthase